MLYIDAKILVRAPWFRAGRAAALAGGVLLTTGAQAQLTLLPSGPQIGTHVGNLVNNGSFETGGPGSTVRFWATGTGATPFGVPPGWTSSGGPSNYASWGRDGGPGPRIRSSDILPHGGNALYFGNGQSATLSSAPVFNASGEVTLSSPPMTSAPFALPVVLTQSVATHLAPAASYVLSFWISGESSGFATAPGTDGIFGLRVTNTQLGDPQRYFVVPGGGPSFGASHRFEFSFTPINPSLPVTLEFTNWGHFSLGAFGFAGTTELVLDDVIVNPVPTPGACGALALAGLAAAGRRRRGRWSTGR